MQRPKQESNLLNTCAAAAPATSGWRNLGGAHRSLYHAGLGIVGSFAIVVSVIYAIRVLSYEPTGTDDSRVILYTGQILRDPGSWIFEILLPLVQYFTYASLVKLFGWSFPLVIVPLVFSVALALLVGYITYRITGETWAFLAAAILLASLPVFHVQARSLPFYPPVLLLGYGGAFAAVLYARGGGRWVLAWAVLGLAGALYSFAIGILFLAVPALYVLIDRGRPVIRRLAAVYTILAIPVTPWLVWHLTVYGFSGLHAQQLNWQIEGGYQKIRNLEFFGSHSGSRIEFLRYLPTMFQDAAGWLIFILAALALVGFIRLPSWSWRVAILTAMAIPIGTLVYAVPAGYYRYIYSVLPALVILSVYGWHSCLRLLSSGRLSAHLAPVAASALLVFAGVAFFQTVRDEMTVIDQVEAGWDQSELPELAAMIDDDRAVLGSRVLPLTRYLAGASILSLGLLGEEDAVTYLRWPSDRAVRAVFEANGVGWVLIRHPADVWERDYNIWLRSARGELPRHYIEIEDSRLVEKVYQGRSYSLYRLVDAAALDLR